MPNAPVRKKRASSGTHERLILATERLIARHGIDGVSMRQIGQAVGLGNNSGVQYHFGTKEKLIEAVLAYRRPGLDARRRALLEQVRRNREPTARDILEILLRPLTELVDEHGEHIHARFIWQLQRPDHIGEQTFHLRTLTEREDELPRMLLERLGNVASPFMDLTIRSAFAMFLFSLISRDRSQATVEGPDLEDNLQIMVDMINAALSAASRAAPETKKGSR